MSAIALIRPRCSTCAPGSIDKICAAPSAGAGTAAVRFGCGRFPRAISFTPLGDVSARRRCGSRCSPDPAGTPTQGYTIRNQSRSKATSIAVVFMRVQAATARVGYEMSGSGRVPAEVLFKTIECSILPSNASSCDTSNNCSSRAAACASIMASASLERLSASTP